MSAAEFLLDLIRIESVSALSNRGVVEYAQRILHQAGWSTRELAYLDACGMEKVNLIAAPPQQDPAARAVDLAFFCHTDTVPFSSSWSGALAPSITDGLVHGCGACDVKGFLACLLQAALSNPRGRWLDGLRIVLTADEEVGCVGAKHLLTANAIRPKRLVIGEPTSLHAARAGKGYCLAEIVVQGVEAHSAHPEQGASAIYAACRMIAKIEELGTALRKQTDDLFSPPYTTLNAGTIQGGTAKNIVPGECRFLVEWRPIPGLSPDYVSHFLEQFAGELKQSDSRLRCNVHALREQAGFATPENSALVEFFVKSTGRSATSIPFASEASIFSPIAEETVVFGPGDMRTAHSDRECVPVDELHEAAEIITKLMFRE